MTQYYGYDSSDFIIEKHTEHQPSWGNSRIVYRLMKWDQQSRRRVLEAEKFWLGQIHSKLRDEFGLEHPEEVPIVDLDG